MSITCTEGSGGWAGLDEIQSQRPHRLKSREFLTQVTGGQFRLMSKDAD